MCWKDLIKKRKHDKWEGGEERGKESGEKKRDSEGKRRGYSGGKKDADREEKQREKWLMEEKET